MQRYLNFWFSSSLDLFGSETSSNAASYFANGLKGRPDESRYEDHVAADQIYTLEVPDGNGGIKTEEIPMRNAMNDVTRGSYVKDCDLGVTRWNRLIEKAGHSFRLSLPSHALPSQHRKLGRRSDRSHRQADYARRVQRAHWQAGCPATATAPTS